MERLKVNFGSINYKLLEMAHPLTLIGPSAFTLITIATFFEDRPLADKIGMAAMASVSWGVGAIAKRVIEEQKAVYELYNISDEEVRGRG